MVVELSDLGGDLSDLPALEAVAGVEDDAVLLLELPQLRVDVEGSPEVSLEGHAINSAHEQKLRDHQLRTGPRHFKQ